MLRKRMIAMTLLLVTLVSVSSVNAKEISPSMENEKGVSYVQAENRAALLDVKQGSRDFYVHSNKSGLFWGSGAMAITIPFESKSNEAYVEVVSPANEVIFSGFVEKAVGADFGFTLLKGDYLIKVVSSTGDPVIVKAQLFG